MNITLPVELVEQLPDGLNVSAACAEALAQRVHCDHRAVRCVACAADHSRHELEQHAAGELFTKIMWALDEPVRKVRSAEHAARVVRDTAARFGIAGAEDYPIARPSRAERARAAAELDRELREQPAPRAGPARRRRAA